MAIKDVVEAIRKYDNFIVTSHVNAEGDAVGSELAVFYLLKQLGKNAIVMNGEPVPERYKFLPGCGKIAVYNGARPEGYENIIVVDCSTVQRSGEMASLIAGSRARINIDHHVSNNKFGDFNWVNPDASSCGEMIFELYKSMSLHINEDIAVLLYVAMLTDTGSFRYDSTTQRTHHIAGELIKLGVHPSRVAEDVYETKEMGDIELLSKALATIKKACGGKITYMYVTKKMLDDTGTTPDMTDGFVNFARSLKGAEISIFFRQDTKDAGTIHVGFRSKGKANVNVLAGKFGGGGHPKASGCLMKGTLDEVMEKVLRVAEEFIL